MASIFENTAKTTLQEQISMEAPSRGSQTGGLVSGDGEEKIGDPEEVFGSASQNWAALAFPEKKIR